MVANQHIRKTSDTGECNKVKEVPSSLIDGEKAAILESIPDPVILVDTDLKVVWSNAALNKLFNLNADQIKGRHCFETMYGLKRPCEACPVIRAINTGQPCTVDDFSSLGKRWMLRAYPLRDEEGNVTRIAEIFTDITESKRAEDTLNKVSKLQSMILDNSTVGIAFVRNRIYEWVNPKLCELYGIPKEQLEGASTRIIFPDDEAYQRQGDEIYSSLAQGKKAIIETCRRKGDGSLFWCRLEGIALDASRPQEGSIWIVEDITKRKLAEEALEKRILTLTKPLDGIEKNITFEDLFNLSDLQRLQDMLADSWGVAALLTRPDGTAITRPSNFTYFCKFIRNNEKGFRNCQKSDAELGQYNPPGPIIHKCLSAGLWGAGASITIGRRHIANWLIGQVRNEAQSEEEIMEYARSIGIDEIAFREAFLQVPVMPQEKFEQIAHALFALANQLSAIAYQNIQQARFIADRKQAEEALRKSEEKFRGIYEESPLGIELYDREGILLDVNRACLDIFGLSDVKAVKKGFKLFENPNLSEECKAQLRRGESVRLEMPYDFEKVTSGNLYETSKRGIIYLDVLITPLRDIIKASDIGYL
ncbi:MAG: PocR ligand-binding domain-containing protein, partial [Smithella sp.]